MLTIDEVYLFVTVDEKGEGLIAELIDGNWVPFICADKARVDNLKLRAEMIAKRENKEVKLIKFTTRTELEVFEGEEEGFYE